MASDNFARVLALAALDDSELKSLEERVDELARIGFKPLIVEELPTEGMDSHTLYLVPNAGEEENDYDEYLWFEDTGWELMGTTSVDLSDYYTKEETDALLDEKQDELTAGNYINIENGVISGKDIGNVFLINGAEYSQSNPFIWANHPVGTYIFYNTSTLFCKGKEEDSTTGILQELSYNTFVHYHTDINTVSGSTTYVIRVDGIHSGYRLLSSHTMKYDPVNKKIQQEFAGSESDFLFRNFAQTISGKHTYNILPESSVTPTTVNQLTNKSYVDTAINAATTQYTTMPEATVSTVGKVVQYTGETDPWYTNGYFYIGVENTGDPTTYDWIQLNVQPETKPNVYMLSTMNNTQQNPVILANCKPGIFVGGTDDHTMLYLKLFEEDPNTYGLDLYYGGENCFYYTTDLSQYDYETYTGTVEFGYTLLPVVSPEDGSKVTNGITRYIYYGGDHSVDSAVTKAQQEYVKTSGAQTINGVKTFTSLPESSATPENDNQLINKLYVDNVISSSIDNKFFDGSITEWNEFTQEQQNEFWVAVVEPYVELTPQDQSNLNSITGSNEFVISDMIEREAVAATDEIIGGGNGE